MTPAFDTVAPGVRRIMLPLPFALKAVNVFLVEGSNGWGLVDSGLHTPDAERVMGNALAEAGISWRDVKRLFVTHLHPDHLGMAGTFERAGTEVVMHEPEIAEARKNWSADHVRMDATFAWFTRHGMPSDVDDGVRKDWLETRAQVDAVERVRGVADGATVELAERVLRLIWTPGHTDHHAVLVDEGDGVLFAGDHVLPRITSNIGLFPHSRNDPLGDYLGALGRIVTLPIRRVLPAHGEPFDDLSGRVQQILAHHAERLEACIDAIGPGERDAYAICHTLFPRLRSAHDERFALAETLAHLRHLELGGKVASQDGAPIRWRAL